MALSVMRSSNLSRVGGEGEDDDLLALDSGEDSNVLRWCIHKTNTDSLALRLVLSVGDDS